MSNSESFCIKFTFKFLIHTRSKTIIMDFTHNLRSNIRTRTTKTAWTCPFQIHAFYHSVIHFWCNTATFDMYPKSAYLAWYSSVVYSNSPRTYQAFWFPGVAFFCEFVRFVRIEGPGFRDASPLLAVLVSWKHESQFG